MGAVRSTPKAGRGQAPLRKPRPLDGCDRDVTVGCSTHRWPVWLKKTCSRLPTCASTSPPVSGPSDCSSAEREERRALKKLPPVRYKIVGMGLAGGR